MKKVFISQPMSGKTREEIASERADAIEMALDMCGEVEIINSVFTDTVESKNEPLYNLGRSLILMAEADIIMFAPGWENARGCRIEHDCALAYNVGVIVDKW